MFEFSIQKVQFYWAVELQLMNLSKSNFAEVFGTVRLDQNIESQSGFGKKTFAVWMFKWSEINCP